MSWRAAFRPVSTSSSSPASRASDAGSPIPYPQKTGLALSGFDAAVRGGRVLIFGESEIRYLESLDVAARDATLGRLYSHDIPAVLITQGFDPPVELSETADRTAVPLLRTRNGTPRHDVAARQCPRQPARAAHHDSRRADGHPGPGRADDRRERHRQERVRARSRRPRPPARRRRHRGAALPRRVVRARQLSRADPPSHGDPRPRPDQHPGSLRRRLDADVEAGRAGRPARTLGAGPRVRSPRTRRCALRRARAS